MTRRWTNVISQFCVLSLLACQGLGASANGDTNKIAAIKRHRLLFEGVPGRVKASSSSFDLHSALVNVESLSGEEWEIFSSVLSSCSKKGTVKRDGDGVFIKDDEVVDVLVAALEDYQTRENGRKALICERLTWDVDSVLRAKYAERIRRALGSRPKMSDSIFLYAKCELSEQQKKEVSSWKDSPTAVKAFFGDKQAETKLLSQFNTETDFHKKSRLAYELAYVGSPRCQSALVDALRSPVVSDYANGTISIRVSILRAMRMIYQNEKLFIAEAFCLEFGSDDVFDIVYAKRGGVKKYIAEVDDWVRERFGHPAWDSHDVWFHKDYHNGIPLATGADLTRK